MLIANSDAQNRGVYPLGMSATNSGVTPAPGFMFANQLLFYSRDESRGPDGESVATGNNSVILAMNSFVWVSQTGGSRRRTVLHVGHAADQQQLAELGRRWRDQRRRRIRRFLLPAVHPRLESRTRVDPRSLRIPGADRRVHTGATSNVGSGYWTHVLASGQTWYLTRSKTTSISAFQMYEFHTTQQGTDIHPGQNLDLDYSVTHTMPARETTLSCRSGWSATANGKRLAGRGPSGHARPDTDPLLGQCHRLRLECRLAAAQRESGLQVLQGIREPVDVSGVLHSDFRVGRFLDKLQRVRSGTMVSPRASMATSSAIFLARPAGVFMLLVRNASANRFSGRACGTSRRARGLASIAARRSPGMVVFVRAADRCISGVPAAIGLCGVDLPLAVRRHAAGLGQPFHMCRD